MTRRFWISVSLGILLLAGFASDAQAWGQPPLTPPTEPKVEADLDQPAAPAPARAAAIDSVGGCGWDQEFGTAAQTECEALLSQLQSTYGIHWDAPTDPAIRLYDFNNRGLRRWKLAEAQALRDALAAWSKALGGVSIARRELGLDELTFKLRGSRYMLRPGNLGEYIDEWNEIDLAGQALQAIDFAHELAHRWERHRGDQHFGQPPNNRTLWFALKFFKTYDAATDTWTADGQGWTHIARGTTGRYNGACPREDFAETTSHVVMQTETAQQYRNSDRYQFMLALMPGLR
jgi:hypothetical protein